MAACLPTPPIATISFLRAHAQCTMWKRSQTNLSCSRASADGQPKRSTCAEIGTEPVNERLPRKPSSGANANTMWPRRARHIGAQGESGDEAPHSAGSDLCDGADPGTRGGREPICQGSTGLTRDPRSQLQCTASEPETKRKFARSRGLRATSRCGLSKEPGPAGRSVCTAPLRAGHADRPHWMRTAAGGRWPGLGRQGAQWIGRVRATDPRFPTAPPRARARRCSALDQSSAQAAWRGKRRPKRRMRIHTRTNMQRHR